METIQGQKLFVDIWFYINSFKQCNSILDLFTSIKMMSPMYLHSNTCYKGTSNVEVHAVSLKSRADLQTEAHKGH